MTKLTPVVLSCALALPLAVSSVAADGSLYVGYAGAKEHLNIGLTAPEPYAEADAESRGPVAGSHLGSTYIASRGNNAPAQIQANIRCGTQWYYAEPRPVPAGSPDLSQHNNCVDEPAEVWEAVLSFQ